MTCETLPMYWRHAMTDARPVDGDGDVDVQDASKEVMGSLQITCVH
jgi:hypothetical protein